MGRSNIAVPSIYKEVHALGVTKIEVSRGIENEKLKEEMLNARIALLDQNNTILELESKLKVQKLQIKERNQVLLDMTVKFEKVMTDLKDINMAKREEKDNEVAFLKMELKHLSTSLDDEKREKRNIVREKDLAVCSLAKAMEREKKNVQEIVRFAIEVERLKAENLKLSKVKDETRSSSYENNFRMSTWSWRIAKSMNEQIRKILPCYYHATTSYTVFS